MFKIFPLSLFKYSQISPKPWQQSLTTKMSKHFKILQSRCQKCLSGNLLMNIISKLINFNLLGFIIPCMIQKRALDWLKNIRFLPYFVATVFNIPTDAGVLFFHFYHMSIKLRILGLCLIKPNIPKRHSLFSTKGQDFNFNVCIAGCCWIPNVVLNFADTVFRSLILKINLFSRCQWALGQYEKRVLIQWQIQGEGPGGPDPPTQPPSDRMFVWDWNSYIDTHRIVYYFWTGWFFNDTHVAFCH